MARSINLIFMIVILSIPLAGAGMDIHVPSLPAIIHFFKVPQAVVQSSVTVYLIGYGVAQLVVGALSDCLGRRPVLLIGAFCYVITCLLSAVCTSMTVFLLLRFLQGVAVAGPGIAAKACMSDLYSGKTLQKKSSYLIIAWGAGPILAPMLGGYLQHVFAWQACFVFLGGYAAMLFVVSYFFFPETKQQRESLAWGPLLMNFRTVLRHPVFVGSVFGAGLVYSIMAVFNVMGPFIIQVSLACTAIQFGHMAFVLGISWLTGSLLNRLLLHYFSLHTILSVGVAVLLLVSVSTLLVISSMPMTVNVVIAPIILLYIAGGLLMPSMFALSMSLFPTLGGTVNAASGMGMQWVTSIITLLASHFSTATQLPMMELYLGIVLCALLVRSVLLRRGKCG